MRLFLFERMGGFYQPRPLKPMKTKTTDQTSFPHRLGCLTAAILSVTTLTATPLPEVPASIAVPEGQKVAFHTFATGVQIYVCRQSVTDPSRFVWVFKAPEATLYDSDGNVVGTHYAGPTWESNSGSKVVGAVLQRLASPDPNAIPWLLLRAVTSEGPGIFHDITYIQRINTTGGKAPSGGCTADDVGHEVGVPYTAEYYFYRATH